MTSPRSPAQHREAAQWVYRGLWSWLVRWLRVPDEPPTLPASPGQLHESFQPAREYLSYLKFNFWLALAIFGGIDLVGWMVLVIAAPGWGALFTAPMWGIVLVPAAITYVAIHLRYDTMWYVVTDRSMRVRRGLWSIHEVTITFENVQTVKVSQGPIQRWFGIGDVEVRTAGGGMIVDAQGNPHGNTGHQGVIEGVTNASEIRDLILAQLRAAKTAGLGDELHSVPGPVSGSAASPSSGLIVTGKHLAILREIRDAMRV